MSHAQLSAAIGEQLDDLLIDEEAGSLAKPPHARLCLLRDTYAIADALSEDELEDEEYDFLEDQAGVIVSVTKDGAVSVRYFVDEDELEDRWADLCEDVCATTADDEDDEDNSDDEEE